jgi:hypothetical protein
MPLTAAQALAYVEERRAELKYEHGRLTDRLTVINDELTEIDDQSRLLRKLNETECPPLDDPTN